MGERWIQLCCAYDEDIQKEIHLKEGGSPDSYYNAGLRIQTGQPPSYYANAAAGRPKRKAIYRSIKETPIRLDKQRSIIMGYLLKTKKRTVGEKRRVWGVAGCVKKKTIKNNQSKQTTATTNKNQKTKRHNTNKTHNTIEISYSNKPTA